VLLFIVVVLAVNLKNRWAGWREITEPVNRLSDMVQLMYADGILPPIGEFPPGSLQSRSPDLEPYYSLSGLSKLTESLPSFPVMETYYFPVKTSTAIISCDFQTGEVYVGFSNIHVAKKACETIIKNEKLYSDIRGTPYAGGDTVLLRSINLRSEDILILRRSDK
jgi:hypothetical protein